MPEIRDFDMGTVKPFYPDAPLPNVALRLPAGRSLTLTETRQQFIALTRSRACLSQLAALPGPRESIHCVLNGEFALWDFVPAVLQLADDPIAELIICTLGFSKHNVTALADLVAAGRIDQVAVLCSHYFAAADSQIYQQMLELCQARGFRVAAMRTHAKLLLIRAGRRRIVIEASANLRSCHNVEQATLWDSPELFDFHRAWIDELITKGNHAPQKDAAAVAEPARARVPRPSKRRSPSRVDPPGRPARRRQAARKR